MEEQAIYGAQYYSNEQTGVSDARSLGEALRTLYGPTDFVVVKNIDTQPLTYQFTNPDSTETFSDYPGHKDTVVREAPKRYTLQPGQSKLCPAYEADMMLTNLVKQILMRQANDKVAKGDAKADMAVDWSNVASQEGLLNKAFLGKHDFVDQYNTQQIAPQTTLADELENELDNTNEQETKSRGRRAAGNPTA